MKLTRMSFAITALLLTQSLVAAAETSACYGFYKKPSTTYALWLETDSAARTAWIRKTSGETLRNLHESTNYQTISDAVLSQNSNPNTLSFDGNKHADYELRFMGLGKPQSLYRITSEGRTEVLTTESITKDTSFSLMQAYASPKDTHLILTASDNGNIDIFQTYIYDLKTKQVVRHFETDGQQIVWKNNKEFFFIDAGRKMRGEKGPFLSLYNLETGAVKPVAEQNLVFLDKNSFVKMDDGHAHLMIRDKPKIFLPKSIFNFDMSLDSVVVRENGDTMIFANDSWNNHGKVLKHVRTNGKSRWETLYETSKDSVIESVQFNEDHIAVNVFWGPSVVTKLLDYSGKELAQVTAPGCCLMSHVNYKAGADIIDVTLGSHFKASATFKYSLKEKRF